MAAKQEVAIKSAITRKKNKGIAREEKHILWILLAIIFILLYLLLAQHNGWWPFLQPKLGSAFYTNVSANGPVPPATVPMERAGAAAVTVVVLVQAVVVGAVRVVALPHLRQLHQTQS